MDLSRTVSGTSTSPYHVPLADLDRARIIPPVVQDGEHDVLPADTGTEYVAQPLKERPNGYSVEGLVQAFGELGVLSKQPGWRGRLGRHAFWVMLAPFLVPVLYVAGQLALHTFR